MKKGLIIKLMVKLEMVRLWRSKIEGYCKEGVFYIIVIIKVFVKIDIIIKMMFIMEFRIMKSYGMFLFLNVV